MRRRSTLHTTTRSSALPLAAEQVWAVVASGYERPQWYVDSGPFVFRAALDRAVGGHGAPWPPPGRPLLVAGDRAGFWHVLEADHDAHRLVLEADVRAPGRVVLTSTVDPDGDPDGDRDGEPGTAGTGGCRLTQVVEFRPRGPLGAAYLVTDLGARGLQMELTHRRLIADITRAQDS